MPATAKTPPTWLINTIGRIRNALGTASRSAVPANIALLEISQGAWLTQALYAAAQLGIADELRDRPRSSPDIASAVGADPGATYRLMRALAANGLLKLHRDGRFSLTRVGQALRSDYDGSMAPMIKLIGHPSHWEHWGNLLYSVKTGESGAEKLRGMPVFDYLDTDPEYAKVFNDAMTGVSAMAIEAAVPAYTFSGHKLIVDVGGGHGALLAAVLATAPGARGVLFDLPSVIAGAGPELDRAGVSDRCTKTGGSFFEVVPEGGDAYLMKTIIHDWDDEKSLTILRNIRTAIAPTGKLLLFELVLPEGAPSHPGMLLDLEMLVHPGGCERTPSEYRDLLARAGFRMTRVIGTAGPMSIVEAVPA